ncbi:MAG: hypothetical protein NT166_30330 [Candidatus Aminicenantes bacterium]|jgi:hypothetical protein|nr:hypothetical protein [Candidatus Aminicenantes bacterium]
MKPKRYIVWSKEDIDLQDSFQKKWYYRQVLMNGRAEDIAAIDWKEIKKYLPELHLPNSINRIWESYFNAHA